MIKTTLNSLIISLAMKRRMFMCVLDDVSFLCNGDIHVGISVTGIPCNYINNSEVSSVLYKSVKDLKNI